MKEITSNRATFPKPVRIYKKMFGLFGENIISTEGEEWKRHRKVVARAFTEPNNKLVWHETVKIMLALFEKWEKDGIADEVISDNVVDVTRDLALMVISSAGKCSHIISLTGYEPSDGGPI
jgi:cytochrome P450